MRILFDASGYWAPNTLRGGSEECVVQLAAALAARGHEVTVCNDCGELAGHHEGVWYRSGGPEAEDDPALVIVQREWRKAVKDRTLFPTSTIALYCHDIPADPHWPQETGGIGACLAAVDKVVLLNEHHRRRYRAVPDGQAAVIRIGIDQYPYRLARQQGGVVRDLHRAIYLSHPGRGLPALRRAWPSVRARVPDATLAAFWWEPEHFMPPVPELGILPMRALRQEEVAREVLASGVFAYASCFDPEVSPAACIHAQIGGAVPVVVPKGGMADVLHFGHLTDEQTFPAALARALIDVDWQERVRAEMMPMVGELYVWERAAREFEELAA